MSSNSVQPIIRIPKLPQLGRTLAAELLGTFVLVYVIAQINDIFHKLLLAGIAIGFALTTLVFTLAHHNSGIFNPAVGFGLYLLGFMSTREYLFQTIIQLVGGTLGGLVVLGFLGGDAFPVVTPAETTSAGIGRMFVAEFIGTAILVTTVTQVAASKQRQNNFFGMAIGLVVVSQAYAVGKYSGGAFNPAVVTGLQITKCIAGDCTHLKYWALYVIAELLGGVFAFLFFCLTGSYAEGEGTNEADGQQTLEEDMAKEHHAYSRITSSAANHHAAAAAADAGDVRRSLTGTQQEVNHADRKNISASETSPLIS